MSDSINLKKLQERVNELENFTDSLMYMKTDTLSIKKFNVLMDKEKKEWKTYNFLIIGPAEVDGTIDNILAIAEANGVRLKDKREGFVLGYNYKLKNNSKLPSDKEIDKEMENQDD